MQQQPFRESDQHLLICTEDGPDSSCELVWKSGEEPKSLPVLARLVRTHDDGLMMIVLCQGEQIGVLDIDDRAVGLLVGHGVSVSFIEDGKHQKTHVSVVDEIDLDEAG